MNILVGLAYIAYAIALTLKRFGRYLVHDRYSKDIDAIVHFALIIALLTIAGASISKDFEYRAPTKDPLENAIQAAG